MDDSTQNESNNRKQSSPTQRSIKTFKGQIAFLFYFSLGSLSSRIWKLYESGQNNKIVNEITITAIVFCILTTMSCVWHFIRKRRTKVKSQHLPLS